MPIDVHVGGRIRHGRMLMGMSQVQLGEALGLTLQQILRLESGLSRVGASRLFTLSRVFDVPISFFYDDLPEPSTPSHSLDQEADANDDVSEMQNNSGTGTDRESDVLNWRETHQLIRAYHQIKEPAVRKRLLELIASMSHS